MKKDGKLASQLVTGLSTAFIILTFKWLKLLICPLFFSFPLLKAGFVYTLALGCFSKNAIQQLRVYEYGVPVQNTGMPVHTSHSNTTFQPTSAVVKRPRLLKATAAANDSAARVVSERTNHIYEVGPFFNEASELFSNYFYSKIS